MSQKNRTQILKSELFLNLERLSTCSEEDLYINMERAKATCQIANTICNVVKTEISMLEFNKNSIPGSETKEISLE